MRYIVTFVFLLACTTTVGWSTEIKKDHYLSVCAMFKDEAPYLQEWLEYYLLLGVDKFYLYDNESSDNFKDILAPYIEEGVVELYHWPLTVGSKNWSGDQKRAYNQCIKQLEGKSDWLALIDIDEFIIPVDKPDLPSYLHEFDEEPNIGAIKANWQLYGTSRLAAIPKDRLLIESLIYKAPTMYETKEKPDNTVVKSIVRPHAVKFFRLHEGDYKEGFYIFPEEGTKFPKEEKKHLQHIQVERLRINHYWTRADDFFYAVKIGRRLQAFSQQYLPIMMQKYDELNQVEDRIMDRFVPELKARLAKRERARLCSGKGLAEALQRKSSKLQEYDYEIFAILSPLAP